MASITGFGKLKTKGTGVAQKNQTAKNTSGKVGTKKYVPNKTTKQPVTKNAHEKAMSPASSTMANLRKFLKGQK